jgi:hypothetical protein
VRPCRHNRRAWPRRAGVARLVSSSSSAATTHSFSLSRQCTMRTACRGTGATAARAPGSAARALRACAARCAATPAQASCHPLTAATLPRATRRDGASAWPHAACRAGASSRRACRRGVPAALAASAAAADAPPAAAVDAFVRWLSAQGVDTAAVTPAVVSEGLGLVCTRCAVAESPLNLASHNRR